MPSFKYHFILQTTSTLLVIKKHKKVGIQRVIIELFKAALKAFTTFREKPTSYKLCPATYRLTLLFWPT